MCVLVSDRSHAGRRNNFTSLHFIKAEVVTRSRRNGGVNVRRNGITVGFKAIGTRLVFHVPVLGRVAALAPLIEHAMPNVIATQVQDTRRDLTREATPLSDDRRA